MIEWQHGGATCVDNLVMLCRTHHRQIHDADWTVKFRDHQPVFVPPAWIGGSGAAAQATFRSCRSRVGIQVFPPSTEVSPVSCHSSAVNVAA